MGVQVQAEPVSEPRISANMLTPELQTKIDIFGQPAVYADSKRTLYEQDTDDNFIPRTGEEAAKPVATPSSMSTLTPVPSPLASWKSTKPVAIPKGLVGDSWSPLRKISEITFQSPRSLKVKEA